MVERLLDAWTTRILSLKPFSSTQILIFDNFSVPGFEKKNRMLSRKTVEKRGFNMIFQVKSTILWLKTCLNTLLTIFRHLETRRKRVTSENTTFLGKKTYWKKKLMENTFLFPTDFVFHRFFSTFFISRHRFPRSCHSDRGHLSAGMLRLLGQRCWGRISAKSQHPSRISARSQQVTKSQVCRYRKAPSCW